MFGLVLGFVLALGAPLPDCQDELIDYGHFIPRVTGTRRQVFGGPVGAVYKDGELGFDEDAITWRNAQNEHMYLAFVNCLPSAGELASDGAAVLAEVKDSMEGVAWVDWTPAMLDSSDPNYGSTVGQYCYDELRDYFLEPVRVTATITGGSAMTRPRPNHVLPFLHANGGPTSMRVRAYDEILVGGAVPAASRITHGHHIITAGSVAHHLVGWAVYINMKDFDFASSPYPIEKGEDLRLNGGKALFWGSTALGCVMCARG